MPSFKRGFVVVHRYFRRDGLHRRQRQCRQVDDDGRVGKLQFHSTAAGRLHGHVSSSGYIASARGVTLTSNQTLSFQLVRMPILFAVNGTVTEGTSGGPLPNVCVQIGDGANAGKSAATDVGGSYTIGGVAPGTFSLSAAAAGYETVTGGMGYSLDIGASAPRCTWTASDDANDWLFLQVQGSGAPYGHAVSGTGSAVVLAAANAYGGATGTRTTAVRVHWTVGGVDIVACQPDC